MTDAVVIKTSAAPAGRDLRFGAAVYGSFLVASGVGVAYEAGEEARTITATLFTSMLIFWLVHAWSRWWARTSPPG